MTLRLFVAVYGDAYLDLYERVALASLLQPLNKAALPRDAVAALYTDRASFGRVSILSASLGIEVETHFVDASDNYRFQSAAFAEEIRFSAPKGDTLIVISPDNFWGDGSLGNLLAIAGQHEVCIAVPHPRVDQATFRLGAYRNAELVTEAMRCLHPSWREAETDRGIANSFASAIGIRHLGNGLHAISHLLPTVFLARPTRNDMEFFAGNASLPGLWDHHWPALLATEGRLRILGDSDAVFIAELTDVASHRPPLGPVDPKRPDAYHRTAPHIELCRSTVSIWRENTA